MEESKNRSRSSIRCIHWRRRLQVSLNKVAKSRMKSWDGDLKMMNRKTDNFRRKRKLIRQKSIHYYSNVSVPYLFSFSYSSLMKIMINLEIDLYILEYIIISKIRCRSKFARNRRKFLLMNIFSQLSLHDFKKLQVARDRSSTQPKHSPDRFINSK